MNRPTRIARPVRILALVAVLGLASAGGSTLAYDTYSTTGSSGNCATCHGDFRVTDTSLADGQTWPSNLHNVHRNVMLSGDCDTCHSSDGITRTGSSDGGFGLQPFSCSGCHGRAEDGTGNGTQGFSAGLRQHHWRAGLTGCLPCHSDSDPANKTVVGEAVLPPYYADPGSGHANMPTDSCDAASEDFGGGPQGLDNDGDLLYDGNDPDCAVMVVCGNGIVETGEECDDGNLMAGDCCAADCTWEPAGSTCDDGLFCNLGETCDGAGTCDGGAPNLCDDMDICTDDTCDDVADQCVNTFDPGNDPSCAGGACGDGNLDDGEQCDDGNLTAGDCCGPDCTWEPTGTACDDGLFCNLGETCDGEGACLGGAMNLCDDMDICTDDSCDDNADQCVNTFDPGNDPTCTGGVCGDGNVDDGEQCDDGNVLGGDCCAADCTWEPAGSTCDDDLFCNLGETCDGAGFCGGGAANSCDDMDICTDDACDDDADQCINDFNPNNDPSCGNPCPDMDDDGFADCRTPLQVEFLSRPVAGKSRGQMMRRVGRGRRHGSLNMQRATAPACDPTGLVCGDCDDGDTAVNPDAVEDCTNRIDDDCNGLVDGNDPACDDTTIDPHLRAKTDCANCHLTGDDETDLRPLHGNNCGACHTMGFGGTFLGPLGTWNDECSACHNPAIDETGNLDEPTKGHRCVVCHGGQRDTSDPRDFHEEHIDKANCVVCHGEIPVVRDGSDPYDVCAVCHQGKRRSSMRQVHERHVPEGLSCLECHAGVRPPIDVTDGPPVGGSTNVCQICHSNEDPDEFDDDLHQEHTEERIDCGACHADASLQDDRSPMPPIDDPVRAQARMIGTCYPCHTGAPDDDDPDEIHEEHVAGQWQWCYNCHASGDDRPLGGSGPVTTAADSCVLCHDGRTFDDPFPFDIHEEHAELNKCYACHQGVPPLVDWPGDWLVDSLPDDDEDDDDEGDDDEGDDEGSDDDER